jgi:hypothetical protein
VDGTGRVTLTVSDHSQQGELREFLGWAAPGVRVLQIPGRPAPGEQGALDVLMLVAGSGGATAAIKTAIRTLPEFLRSRKTAVSISVTVDGKKIEVEASNIDDLMPVLDRMLDA